MTLANPIASGLTQDQIALVKRTIAPKATNDELSLFVAVCNRTQLDPFSRQIHCVHRWNGREKREVMSIQVSIDGFRLIAQRSGEYAGQVGPEWCGEDGQWRDVWLSNEPPRAARVGVMRKGFTQCLFRTAHWDEYRPVDREGKLMGLWPKMPALMLGKVAEALALRSAFPAETSGLYTEDEMAQAMSADSGHSTGQEKPFQPVSLPAPPQPAGNPANAPEAVLEPAATDLPNGRRRVTRTRASLNSAPMEAPPAPAEPASATETEPVIDYVVTKPPREARWGTKKWAVVKIANGRESSNGTMRFPILFSDGEREEWASVFSDTLCNEISRAHRLNRQVELHAVMSPPHGMTVYGVRQAFPI